MATTVGAHTIATFTSPLNGTTPIDANTVRGNDNTIQVAHNDHDSDPGIHVQSSTLALRPPAGSEGRKWMTVDGTVHRLWYDNGSVWIENSAAALSTARTINGVAFDGTANITVPAAAGTLTGATLASNVTASSLTSVGTLTNLTVTNPISGSVTGSAASATNATNASNLTGASNQIRSVTYAFPAAQGAASTILTNDGAGNLSWAAPGAAAAGTLTGTTLAANVVSSSLTSVGTLTSLAVSSTAQFSDRFTNSSARAFVISRSSASAVNSNFVGFVIQNSAVATNGITAGMYIANDGVSDLRVNNAQASGGVSIWTADTARWTVNSSGHLLAATDATYDIGASGATRPRDLYLSGNATVGGWVRASAASAGVASTTTIGNGTSTTVGATGAASALPANPLGYIIAHVGTTQVKIPYYNV